MGSDQMTTVAIVDDHALVRAGLRTVFERSGWIDVAAEFADPVTFLHQLQRLPPLDVVLLDITLPRLDGLAVLERLRAWRTPPPVLILSMHPERTHAARALALGAHGYITKDADDAVLLDAVRTVALGGIYVSETGGEALLRDSHGHGDGHAETVDALSDQERRVFMLLRQGLTSKEIARDLDLSPKTVSTYKARLMRKLGLRTLVDLVRFEAD